jgi:hypothetical protein
MQENAGIQVLPYIGLLGCMIPALAICISDISEQPFL